MKETLYLLIGILLLSQTIQEKCDIEDDSINSVSDCEKRDLDADKNEYRCCFYEQEITLGGQTQKSKGCTALTKAEFDDIDDYIDKGEERAKAHNIEIEDFDIDCSSIYITISLLSLIILFI